MYLDRKTDISSLMQDRSSSEGINLLGSGMGVMGGMSESEDTDTEFHGAVKKVVHSYPRYRLQFCSYSRWMICLHWYRGLIY